MIRKNRFVPVLCTVLAAGMCLTGCGSSSSDPDQTVATINGTQISLGLANYMAQYTAVDYDTYYMSYFGSDMWTTTTSGSDETMTDRVKDNILDTLEEYYLLEEHMDDYGVTLTAEELGEIETAAADFMAANSAEAIEAMGASQEYVTEQLRLATIQQKMYDAIVADADTNVSDEECAQKTFSYVRVSKTTADDDSEDLTDEEIAAAAKEKAQEILDEAMSGSSDDSLKTAAEDHDTSKATCSYGASDLESDEDNSTYLDMAVLDAAETLSEGEYYESLIDTDKYYYVIRMDSLDDKDAAERERKSIISERKQTLYKETVSGYKEDAEWSIDEKVWEPVNFETLYTKASVSTTNTTTDSTTDTTNTTTDSTTDTTDTSSDSATDTTNTTTDTE